MLLDTLLGHRFSATGSRKSVTRGTNVFTKLFGLPFLIAGGAFVYFGLFFEMTDAETGSAISVWIQLGIVVVFGLPMLAFGLVAVLGRRGVALDREAGYVDSWFGLLFPVRRTRKKFGKTDRVVLARASRRSGSTSQGNERSSVVYAVRLNGSGRPELDTFTNERAARAFAERAARTLELGLENRLGKQPEYRPLEELDLPIAARLRARSEAEPTADTRLRVEPGTAGGSVLLPARGFGSLRSVLVFLAVVAFFGWIALPMVREGDAVSLFFVALVIVVALVTLWSLFGDEFTVERIEVSPEGLVVDKRLGPFRNRRSIPLNELEELYLDESALRAVSDRHMLRIGGAHSDGDLEYLLHVLEGWIVRATPA